jgi:hypothetical protein
MLSGVDVVTAVQDWATTSSLTGPDLPCAV